MRSCSPGPNPEIEGTVIVNVPILRAHDCPTFPVGVVVAEVIAGVDAVDVVTVSVVVGIAVE